MSWAVPLTDVVVTERDIDAVLECLAGGWLTMGPRIEQFEHALAELCGVPHAVAVSSGTAALHLALLAAGVRQGDEVIVPSLTYVAGAAAVRYCGALPVFADSCGSHDLNMDPDDVEQHVGPRTRAVLATHWMGYACDLARLERICEQHGLALIEDCAQSITARAADGRMTGSVGAAGCLSFFSKEQLCVGEGGMVLTSDDGLAAKARSLRSHAMTSVTWDRHRGHAVNYDVLDIGFNLRMDEPRAALGLSRLPRLRSDVQARRELAFGYRRLLAKLPGITLPWTDDEAGRAAHFGFPILLGSELERDRVSSELTARGIQTTAYPAITTLSAYLDHPRCPRAEDLAARHVLLPLSSTFADRQLDLVVSHLTEIAAADS